jgi:hypothetical protein
MLFLHLAYFYLVKICSVIPLVSGLGNIKFIGNSNLDLNEMHLFWLESRLLAQIGFK